MFGWDLVIWRSLGLLAIVVGSGTAGYIWIEGWSAWRSFFFTLITLSTVGYGDNGLSVAGEQFTAVLMICGIGTVSYTATSLLHRAVARAAHPERRIMQRIKHLQGHHVVCGLGRTGVRVIEKLLEEAVDVVAIDTSSRAVEEMRTRGVLAIEGDASLDDTLAQAGVDRACAVAALTSSDAVNALICLTARALTPETTIIARAEDASSVRKLQRAGATSVITPASYGGDGIAQYMLRPEAGHLLPGLQTEGAVLAFAELFILRESPHYGRTIEEVGGQNPRIIIVAARGTDQLVTVGPNPKHILEEGDVLVVAGISEDVKTLRTLKRAA